MRTLTAATLAILVPALVSACTKKGADRIPQDVATEIIDMLRDEPRSQRRSIVASVFKKDSVAGPGPSELYEAPLPEVFAVLDRMAPWVRDRAVREALSEHGGDLGCNVAEWDEHPPGNRGRWLNEQCTAGGGPFFEPESIAGMPFAYLMTAILMEGQARKHEFADLEVHRLAVEVMLDLPDLLITKKGRSIEGKAVGVDAAKAHLGKGPPNEERLVEVRADVAFQTIRPVIADDAYPIRFIRVPGLREPARPSSHRDLAVSLGSRPKGGGPAVRLHLTPSALTFDFPHDGRVVVPLKGGLADAPKLAYEGIVARWRVTRQWRRLVVSASDDVDWRALAMVLDAARYRLALDRFADRDAFQGASIRTVKDARGVKVSLPMLSDVWLSDSSTPRSTAKVAPTADGEGGAKTDSGLDAPKLVTRNATPFMKTKPVRSLILPTAPLGEGDPQGQVLKWLQANHAALDRCLAKDELQPEPVVLRFPYKRKLVLARGELDDPTPSKCLDKLARQLKGKGQWPLKLTIPVGVKDQERDLVVDAIRWTSRQSPSGVTAVTTATRKPDHSLAIHVALCGIAPDKGVMKLESRAFTNRDTFDSATADVAITACSLDGTTGAAVPVMKHLTLEAGQTMTVTIAVGLKGHPKQVGSVSLDWTDESAAKPVLYVAP